MVDAAAMSSARRRRRMGSNLAPVMTATVSCCPMPRRSPRRQMAVALVVLSSTIAHPAWAQLPPFPAPVVLSLPGSTRALGMGDAYAAMTGDPDLIFYNPAQLGAARGLGIAAHRFGTATHLITISGANALAPGGIGFGIQLLDHAAPSLSL